MFGHSHTHNHKTHRVGTLGTNLERRAHCNNGSRRCDTQCCGHGRHCLCWTFDGWPRTCGEPRVQGKAGVWSWPWILRPTHMGPCEQRHGINCGGTCFLYIGACTRSTRCCSPWEASGVWGTRRGLILHARTTSNGAPHAAARAKKNGGLCRIAMNSGLCGYHDHVVFGKNISCRIIS